MTPSRILIVEDDGVTLDTYARMLALQGYHVRTAVSGETAWHEAEVQRPDAVIVDLRLPGIDGVELLRRLRASTAHRDVPAALVTGNYHLDEAITTELRRFGVAIRFKPLWFEDLEALVDQLLGAHAVKDLE